VARTNSRIWSFITWVGLWVLMATGWLVSVSLLFAVFHAAVGDPKHDDLTVTAVSMLVYSLVSPPELSTLVGTSVLAGVCIWAATLGRKVLGCTRINLLSVVFALLFCFVVFGVAAILSNYL